ncbi:type II toxin-antitoxin system RelE family toxin [Rothia mucilaginosa]|nr:type II toxin-antitoxin system RelE/ParE family toxin [Rothia mucilaginosa]
MQVLFKGPQCEEGYRAQVGNYRILYTIDNGAVVVEVFRVGHRREVYRGL